MRFIPSMILGFICGTVVAQTTSNIFDTSLLSQGQFWLLMLLCCFTAKGLFNLAVRALEKAIS